ncbi:hypothetical protein A1OE_892 [Candidatus Endolissoclinum faulkneri L2]|uniref:Uncharacterized protein n=1 Tax=Candidatus Endolissoclinum faulkneri L2 TaxID=1193729 RepID=K7ZD12_9PROT|nr:hypothetical protein A1OE_892 [Candidatus Endolissoclinum faulkneri L2]
MLIILIKSIFQHSNEQIFCLCLCTIYLLKCKMHYFIIR